MEIKKSILKNASIIILGLIIILGIILLSTKKPDTLGELDSNLVTSSDGRQIINVAAKGGYQPAVITAESNKETTLIVNTNNTFDCSSAFTIPKLGVSKNLPPSGKTEFNLGSFNPGDELDGTCTMGMYSFKIKFI